MMELRATTGASCMFYPGDETGFGFSSMQGRVGQYARQHSTTTSTGVGGE
jgi:hypothetical protein